MSRFRPTDHATRRAGDLRISRMTATGRWCLYVCATDGAMGPRTRIAHFRRRDEAIAYAYTEFRVRFDRPGARRLYVDEEQSK